MIANDRIILSLLCCFLLVGCFWGTEKFFKVDFPLKYGTGVTDGGDAGSGGVLTDIRVGYMGPSTALVNPTYAQVCSGFSQHVEVCAFTYSGGDQVFEALCRHFFSFHDPTTENRQGIMPSSNIVML